MKKLTALFLALACALCLTACAGSKDDSGIIDLQELSGLVSEKGYTEEDFQDSLSGQSRSAVVELWGDPDGMLSGFWGDIWELTSGNQQIILYYDGDGNVETIRLAPQMPS